MLSSSPLRDCSVIINVCFRKMLTAIRLYLTVLIFSRRICALWEVWVVIVMHALGEGLAVMVLDSRTALNVVIG